MELPWFAIPRTVIAMSIKLAKLRCPRCSKSLGIPRKLAGKTSPCPKCGESFSIADDLSKLLPLGAIGDEEPIDAQVADGAKLDEPPLALSVEKPARFSPLLLILGGVTIFTLIVIGIVVAVLPSTTNTTPNPAETPQATAPAEPSELEEETAPATMDPTETEPVAEEEPAAAAPTDASESASATPVPQPAESASPPPGGTTGEME
ncbi:hypothetical protein C5Y97_29050 [Blastopirellula marina]|uniref:Uncharacterized protein n=2 Tax=Blastopirellula marina TaxID=124 RepID=A0A2S8F3U2_9BACT|nr:hypothetical protein C5Y98_29035 [Blastopirellula marina]PTL41027.1 hypothetical protein C5Y97_29050 [Blastopirellula marina]